MKKQLLLAVLALLLMSSQSFADETISSNGFYAGIKLGSVHVNEDEIDDLKDSEIDVEIDDAGLGGVQIGYRFLPSLSIEFDIASSEHEVTYGLPQIPEQDLTISTFGMYIAYRSQGQWYFKGRAGLISRGVEFSPEFEDQDEDSEGLISIGFGGGVRIDRFNIEAEFSSIEKGIGSFGFVGIVNF